MIKTKQKLFLIPSPFPNLSHRWESGWKKQLTKNTIGQSSLIVCFLFGFGRKHVTAIRLKPNVFGYIGWKFGWKKQPKIQVV